MLHEGVQADGAVALVEGLLHPVQQCLSETSESSHNSHERLRA